MVFWRENRTDQSPQTYEHLHVEENKLKNIFEQGAYTQVSGSARFLTQYFQEKVD